MSATWLLVIVLNVVSALGARAATDTFDWHIGLVTIVAGAGTLLGKRFATASDDQRGAQRGPGRGRAPAFK